MGKSFICLELARALISGQHPFACDKLSIPEPTRVLYLEAEIGQIGVQDRVRRSLLGFDKTISDRLSVMSHLRVVRLDDPQSVKCVIQWAKDCGAMVIIFDPISKFHSYSENDNAATKLLFEKFDLIQSEIPDCSIIISHHFSKTPRSKEDYDPLSLHEFRGASFYVADPDTIATFSRQDNVIPFPAWRLVSRWITRQGIVPFGESEAKFNVMENENGRVIYVPPKVVGAPKL